MWSIPSSIHQLYHHATRERRLLVVKCSWHFIISSWSEEKIKLHHPKLLKRQKCINSSLLRFLLTLSTFITISSVGSESEWAKGVNGEIDAARALSHLFRVQCTEIMSAYAMVWKPRLVAGMDGGEWLVGRRIHTEMRKSLCKSC